MIGEIITAVKSKCMYVNCQKLLFSVSFADSFTLITRQRFHDFPYLNLFANLDVTCKNVIRPAIANKIKTGYRRNFDNLKTHLLHRGNTPLGLVFLTGLGRKERSIFSHAWESIETSSSDFLSPKVGCQHLPTKSTN